MNGAPTGSFDGDPLTAGLGPPDEAGGTGSLLAAMRGGGADGGADVPLEAVAAPRRRQISVQTLVLALVLAASAGALFMMRRQGMAAGVRFDQLPPIEYSLDEVNAKPTLEQQRLLAELDRLGDAARGALERLPKNPFVLDLGNAAAAEVADPFAEARDTGISRQRELQTALAALELHGVMEGRVPLARINGETVRIGDIVGEHFKVVGIAGRSVDLEADGQIYTLTIGERVEPPPAGPRGPQRPRR